MSNAGILVLEDVEHASRRVQAHHVTAPPEDGEGAARVIAAALEDGLRPDEIQYLNGHATSSPLGNHAEATAIADVFGREAGLAFSSTKSMAGHLLGAAGAVEAELTVLALFSAAASGR
jgi:3-oxoacyl-[acyl-carrier-protein] synthase II